jgi:hypothetical protein
VITVEPVHVQRRNGGERRILNPEPSLSPTAGHYKGQSHLVVRDRIEIALVQIAPFKELIPHICNQLLSCAVLLHHALPPTDIPVPLFISLARMSTPHEWRRYAHLQVGRCRSRQWGERTSTDRKRRGYRAACTPCGLQFLPSGPHHVSQTWRRDLSCSQTREKAQPGRLTCVPERRWRRAQCKPDFLSSTLQGWPTFVMPVPTPVSSSAFGAPSWWCTTRTFGGRLRTISEENAAARGACWHKRFRDHPGHACLRRGIR